VLGSCTRLLTDLNRSPSNRSVFSDFTAHLSGTEKEKILKTYHEPFRKSVTKAFRCCTFPVIHISVHSFTPVFKGKERNVDIGLLFDPARENEKHFAAFLGRAFKYTDFRVRMNSPYQGKTDGTATWLRTLHHGGSYIGLELELNQSLIKSGKFEKPLLEKIADRILEYVQ
jgi:predicted N-formylglutamate amidohydrolase